MWPQPRSLFPLASSDLFSIPYQDDFSKIQVLYHAPPPEQFFSFLLALWIKITSSWQGQQVLALAELSVAASLANFLLDDSTESTPASSQSFDIPASGPLHLLLSLTPPPSLPLLIF